VRSLCMFCIYSAPALLEGDNLSVMVVRDAALESGRVKRFVINNGFGRGFARVEGPFQLIMNACSKAQTSSAISAVGLVPGYQYFPE